MTQVVIRMKLTSIIDNISNWKIVTWVLLGLAVGYFLFFIQPVFINSSQAMQFFEYIPTFGQAGMDLETTIWYAKLWVVNGYSPYVGGGTFPPLAHVFFVPLLSLDFPIAYRIFTAFTLLCFLLTTLWIPYQLFEAERKKTLILLIFISGLFSYGLQFEIERGQFSVIAYALSLLSIYLFHRHERAMPLSYILLSIAVQLKIYPAIFAVMLIKDWRVWKDNLKRMIGLAAFNILALFSLGTQNFRDFVNAMSQAQFVKGEAWVGNHSISSFAKLYSPSASALETGLLIFAAASFFLILYMAYKENNSELNAFLLLSTTIITLLVPSISHDYRLSVLPAAMAIALASIELPNFSRKIRLLIAPLVMFMAAVYSSTLFSYTNKPDYFVNNMPALMVILLLITVIAVVQMKYAH